MDPLAKSYGMDGAMTQRSELYACLYAEGFPTQALLRLRPGLRNCACAVMDGEPPLRFVCSHNLQASQLGIAQGMTQVEIETFASVTVLLRSKVEEATVKAVLLECAGSFSPRIEDQSTGREFLCVIDIAGMGKLFTTPRQLAEMLLERVKAIGIAAQVAISSNFHAAVCLVRGMSKGTIAVIPPGKERMALAPLPLSVFDLPEKLAETFTLWGIRTLGMLAALPEKSLVARIGQEGRRFWEMARGECPHFFLPVEAVFSLEEQIELDSPVELLTSLLFVLDVMLEQLILRAAAHALALAAVTVALSLEEGRKHLSTVRPALPSNDRQMWIKLMHLDLEAHPPQASVLSLFVKAEPGKISKVQLGLFSSPLPEPAQLDVTLARIHAIVGENNIGHAELQDTHRPDTFRMGAFSVAANVAARAELGQPHLALRQLRPPEKTAMTFHSHKPAAFSFREKRYRVKKAYGPWVSSGDWWNPQLWGFEQWDLIACSQDGELLYCCLMRDLTRDCWQVAALYD
jgi:protein ImuB